MLELDRVLKAYRNSLARYHPRRMPSLTAGESRSAFLLIRAKLDRQQPTADRWTEQLKDAAASVDQFRFQDLLRTDGEPVKDLNDLLKISPNSYRRNTKVIDNVMRF